MKNNNKKEGLSIDKNNWKQILSGLSNSEIAYLVRTYIWTGFPLSSSKSELIEEVIDRFEEEEEISKEENEWQKD